MRSARWNKISGNYAENAGKCGNYAVIFPGKKNCDPKEGKNPKKILLAAIIRGEKDI